MVPMHQVWYRRYLRGLSIVALVLVILSLLVRAVDWVVG